MSRNEWVTIVAAIVVVVIISAGLWFYFRQRFVRMAEKVEHAIDAIIDGRELKTEELNKDTLFSKIQSKLEQLSEVTKSAEEKNVKQKEEMQKMVSDISHQLKTPIANITMYNDTILNHDLPAKQQYRFLKIMQKQVEKLDFLVRSLMKMSRLENSMIKLKKEENSLFDMVVENLSIPMEKKKLDLQIDCPKNLRICYDRKWTAEALFNVMDNAVKYTPEYGKIRVEAEVLGMFVRLSVSDTGIGIAPEHMNDVFQRFFREEKVHNEKGVGIGLYLAREIITKQGGYMKVVSKEDAGSTFFIYLPNEQEELSQN
ncbi:MAG: HAMP domain-containing sensor histidine kinase [Faecalimonas sp.]|nr:HAMP domain-containing sensor histidine kinase [Faecalimonas sp.]